MVFQPLFIHVCVCPCFFGLLQQRTVVNREILQPFLRLKALSLRQGNEIIRMIRFLSSGGTLRERPDPVERPAPDS